MILDDLFNFLSKGSLLAFVGELGIFLADHPSYSLVPEFPPRRYDRVVACEFGSAIVEGTIIFPELGTTVRATVRNSKGHTILR